MGPQEAEGYIAGLGGPWGDPCEGNGLFVSWEVLMYGGAHLLRPRSPVPPPGLEVGLA